MTLIELKNFREFVTIVFDGQTCLNRGKLMAIVDWLEGFNQQIYNDLKNFYKNNQKFCEHSKDHFMGFNQQDDCRCFKLHLEQWTELTELRLAVGEALQESHR